MSRAPTTLSRCHRPQMIARRSLAISLTSMLMVAPKQIAASAVKAKAGATCSKLNQTQVVGSLKFTCIKKAGEVFGLQRDNPLDYNIFDGSKRLTGFANPAAYLTGDTFKPYTADYLDYFSAELRPYYEDTLQRTTAPRVGKIDYDSMGGAAGNWFVKDHFGFGCNSISAYENATAPHEVDTSAWIFSTGWWKDEKGDPKQFVIDVDSAKLTPDQITEKSGTVFYRLTFIAFSEPTGSPERPDGGTAPYAIGYQLFKPSTQQVAGYLAVQIRADGTMAIDVFADSAPPTGMTANPRVYSR